MAAGDLGLLLNDAGEHTEAADYLAKALTLTTSRATHRSRRDQEPVRSAFPALISAVSPHAVAARLNHDKPTPHLLVLMFRQKSLNLPMRRVDRRRLHAKENDSGVRLVPHKGELSE